MKRMGDDEVEEELTMQVTMMLMLMMVVVVAVHEPQLAHAVAATHARKLRFQNTRYDKTRQISKYTLACTCVQ
jgi:hypothetical protein